MTLEELDRRLDDRFRLLAGGNRTAVARQQSLRALIEWSVQLLTADERVLFRRLSVFNGDFTSAMVDEICAAAPIQTDTIFDSLVGLVDKSLVLVEPSVAEQRYRLFDSTRAFAREELDGAQESAHVHAAHLAYFERRAEAARHGFEGENWPEQCTWISANHANFRAALEWSLAERNDVERGTRVATGLLEYWYNYGLHQPALAWLEVARESADALTAHTRAHLFAALGNAQYAVHSRALAEASLRVAVTLFEELEGAEIELAIARNNLALLLPADPEHVESKRELFAAALATYERMGNATQRMSTGINLASIELLSGNIVGANERLQGVVPQAYDAANEPLLYSAYFRVAAYATYLLGDVATARTQMAQSVDLARPFGETLTWAARLAFLGLCQWGCNEHVTALMNLAVSLRILGAAPFSPFAIQALFCYGRVLAETDDLRTAVILVAVAQRLTRERGSASPLGMHLTWLHDRARDALGEHGVADAVRAARDMTYEAALAAASSSLASAALVAHADGVAANIAAG